MSGDQKLIRLLYSNDGWILMERLVKVCKHMKELTLKVSEKGVGKRLTVQGLDNTCL
jgi:uncharacterized protein YjhX (UPF0386 family)